MVAPEKNPCIVKSRATFFPDYRVLGEGMVFSESTDVFVVTSNRGTFFFPETENFGDLKLHRN